jgi:hypothetical protein
MHILEARAKAHILIPEHFIWRVFQALIDAPADFDNAVRLNSNHDRRKLQFGEARYDGRKHWQVPENSLFRRLKQQHGMGLASHSTAAGSGPPAAPQAVT